MASQIGFFLISLCEKFVCFCEQLPIYMLGAFTTIIDFMFSEFCRKPMKRTFMYSTNKTWFAMGFTKIFMDEDNWRFTAAGGLGSINFQFYLDNPIKIWVPYNTRADFVFAEVARRIYDKIYITSSLLYSIIISTSSSVYI